MGYREYLSVLYERIPEYIYEGGVSLFILGAVLIFAFKGIRKGWRKIASLLLIEYVFLIYCSTVIFRETSDAKKYKPTTIEIYKVIIENGSFHIHPEILLNVLVFVPFGLLVCLAIKSLKWWQTLMIGCGMSVSIEILQYVLKRGTTEFGDVLHNTIGCIIGAVLCKSFTLITSQRRNIILSK